ncbi:MAG TPA: heavy-metal-associated domain-containing protein [Thermoanaerobaculia bacterium]|nr:heavy-metal-associated domain-containing protein [Thermoanaerobaculia bacterium]
MKRIGLAVATLGMAAALHASAKSVTLTVRGWTCGSCAAATRIALRKLDGVEEVKTDHERMEATVTYDDAKVGPEELVQAIEKLGYKATVKAAASWSASSPLSEQNTTVNAPASPERVSFFEVPLECGAAADLGCGSASKPVLKAIEKDPRVKEAKINHPGTVLAVVWNDPEQARSGATTVEAALKARDLEATILRGPARDKALKEYGSGRWYGAAEVDRLSEREAQVIATRLVNRAKSGLGLAPEKLAALTRDLSGGIATILTRDKGEECARDPFEELTQIASKHLDQKQLAELRKAAEQGAGALPGEAR